MADNGPITTRLTLTNGLVRLLMGTMPFHTEHRLDPSLPFQSRPDARTAMRTRPGVPQRRYARWPVGSVWTLRP